MPLPEKFSKLSPIFVLSKAKLVAATSDADSIAAQFATTELVKTKLHLLAGESILNTDGENHHYGYDQPGEGKYHALDAFDRGAKRLGLKHATTNEKRSGAGAAAATDAFSDILKQEQIDDMNASPIIGVGCDESTDVAVIEQLILFVYFTKDGTVKSQYFEIVDLHGATAEAIKKALVDALDRRVPGLKKKLLMLGSDGCSVVLGKDKGLGALLRRSEEEFGEGSPIAYLLQLHCMGHKLQLSVGEGLKTPETHQVDRLLTGTYGIFSHSGQRREGLGKVYDELKNAVDELPADAKMKSTKRHIKVRWLSREQSIDSLLGPLDALVAYLHILKKPKSRNRSAGEAADDGEHDDDPDLSETGRMALGELAVAFGDFEQVAMLHFCGDICEQLATMSRTLQADNADVHVALSNVDGLIQSLGSC